MRTNETVKRLTRVTHILLQLQSRRLITAQELATKFGISRRTVYRDIRMLEDAGVPVVGEIGTGYFLRDDFRIPPVMFTEHEVNALLTAREYLSANPDRSVLENIDNLVDKVKAVLRQSAREKADRIENRIKIYDSGKQEKTSYLSIIQFAITNCRIISMSYHAIYSDEVSIRSIEPLAVYYTKDTWLMIAFCQLRKAIREFRVDRILNLADTQKVFPERHFSFEEYLNEIIEKNLGHTDKPLS